MISLTNQIRVGVDFTATPSDHLLWGFALYGSDGSMDLDNPGDVRLRDILDLLLCLTLKHLRKKVGLDIILLTFK